MERGSTISAPKRALSTSFQRERAGHMTTAKFYGDRADDARRAADNATLDNVRDKCLLSVGVWEMLAERAGRVDAERIVRETAAEVRRLQAEA
jgi:hypothetical protein